MPKSLTDLFDQQSTSSSSSTSRIPPGAVPFNPLLEEAFDLVLQNLDSDSGIYNTMLSIYEYAQKNNFVTSGQWSALRKMLEFRHEWDMIEELNAMQNDEGER